MKKYGLWLTAALLIIIMFGTSYAVVQQAQREDANSPQIQLAEDTARSLDAGRALESYSVVDMDTSLKPFVIVYDKAGKPVAGSGRLGKSLAKAPIGILRAAEVDKPYHAVTWQPQANVRVAAVTVAAKDYYVLSGRSLTEVEKNEAHSFDIAALGCLVSLVVLGISYLLVRSPIVAKKR